MAATYTVKQVAEILGYSTNSIYTFLQEKRIKGVRVGTGRFRIPQSELDRLLLISQKQRATVATTVPAVTQSASQSIQTQSVGVTDATGSTPIERSSIFGFVHLGRLNIFDWFIGTVAIVSGLTLFLFTTFADRFNSAEWITVIPILRILLIGGGIGVLITNLIGQTHHVWHKMFHIFIGLSFWCFSFGFWRVGEIDGVLTFGFFGLLILASTMIHFGGAAWVSLYITMLTVTSIVSVLFAQQNLSVIHVLTLLPVSQFTLASMMIATSALFLAALWYGYKKSKQFFMITTWIFALWYFLVAFWYANDSYWTRSFFFLVVGMTTMFLSPWEALASARSRKADLFTLGVFGAMFVILVAGVTGVYLMQSNIIAILERENTNKVTYAKHSFEATVESVRSTIVGASTNSEFTDAVAKKDLVTVNRLERVMFDSNNAIRRLVLLDRDGQGFNLYPYGTFDQPDFSGRDYFIQARDTGQSYVTDLFEAEGDQSRRLVVYIATPLLGTHHEFVGVLAASLNLEGIGARLQKIAVPERGEYIVVVDSHGKRIIHPDSTFIGGILDRDDPMRQGLTGGSGTFVGTTYTGVRAMVAYDMINTNGLHWVIAIKSPTAKLYKLTDLSNVSIFSVIVASVIVAGAILSGGFFYRRRGKSGGSP